MSTLIKLFDARRGLQGKCMELFSDKKVADAIYKYLCDGIEDCETYDEPGYLKHARWISYSESPGGKWFRCTACDMGTVVPTRMGEPLFDFCPYCGAQMERSEDAAD